MKKKTIFSAIALAASAVTFNVTAEEKKLTLMLDWFVNPNHGPIVIAKERGYFKEEGITVNVQEPADPSTPPKLVAANKVDLAISYQPNLTIDVAAGLPLIRAATLVATPLNTLTVLKGKVNNLSELKGKKIGIAIAGNEEATIGTMLNTHNVDYKDVEIINVGWALSSSLASGKVDAIWGGFRNFESNQLALEGYDAKAFFPEEHGVPTYDELVFVANAKTHDKEAIKAFNRALEKATTYIVNHPQQSWKEFVAYSPDTLNNELNKRAWNDTLTRFALRPSAVDHKRYDDYAQFMYDQKIIETLPKAVDYIPNFN
ncbi:putative Hydroxymethylpyrimidine ABC transporter, periplasmic component [Vibrio nigripulchritudo MADA3029]|uniref:ABC transporter substrate-binding protein n=1 Tax=Vibrio nigripulchritudo TaxID=28173 RepID=UPI0003B17E06|nr:ABC transporter substrate-binding protein [Vibrio nigripulchritudo]CCN45666.1 putative Hydroxymethylpyrimidine ABC transporter, periplasmic component [Vibrio nigripulchritudo MADA3020]CCN52991.1 putative Hydroxymethylpyrimidine ABC transporter, periplasmic component [Vibrio nigripulchritudo MADA3021]CCN61573.1 putative Hydroxymethylpyrimidine ABC transporter, periplasmic component [Vibrio nigripulchritudo MADA3029]